SRRSPRRASRSRTPRRSTTRSRAPPRSRSRATPSCSRRRARASTCSATTRTAARSSSAPCSRSPRSTMLADLLHRFRTRVEAPAAPQPAGPVDTWLAGAVLALVAFGVVMVYSASAVFAERQLHDAQHFLVRQAEYAVVGVVLLVALARTDYHKLRLL